MVGCCGIYPRTQSLLHLTHLIWWACSFVEKPSWQGGVRVCWHFVSSVFLSLPFTCGFAYRALVFSLLVLIFLLTFPPVQFLSLCQCLHTNPVSGLLYSLSCTVGAFKELILHQRVTCNRILPPNQVTDLKCCLKIFLQQKHISNLTIVYYTVSNTYSNVNVNLGCELLRKTQNSTLRLCDLPVGTCSFLQIVLSLKEEAKYIDNRKYNERSFISCLWLMEQMDGHTPNSSRWLNHNVMLCLLGCSNTQSNVLIASHRKAHLKVS